MAKILFVHNNPSRFVRMDLELLRNNYSVTELYLNSRRLNPLTIYRRVAEHDLVFGWFASWHSFFPMLFAQLTRKPSVLVIGGYDLANMPAIGYGHQRGGLKKWVSRWTMSLSAGLITNAGYSRDEAEQNAGISKERVQVVYHGLPDPFGELPSEQLRERMVLTVGNIDSQNLWRKGHEPFVKAAALLPDVKFVVAGAWKDRAIDYLRSISTPNVTFTGWIEDEALLNYYRRASVYIQASSHEGFGMSLAEAMLAGCIPLVTKAGAIPEVVGECGKYITLDEKAIAQAVRESLDSPLEVRREVRLRILREFPLEKREQAFSEIINNLLQNQYVSSQSIGGARSEVRTEQVEPN